MEQNNIDLSPLDILRMKIYELRTQYPYVNISDTDDINQLQYEYIREKHRLYEEEMERTMKHIRDIICMMFSLSGDAREIVYRGDLDIIILHAINNMISQNK